MEKKNDVAYITLSSPPVNIMTGETMNAITQALLEIAGDQSLKAVAFKAEGKAFSAGADVKEHHPDKAAGMIGAFSRMFTALGNCELPVVMAVGGAALGAGFELVMLADVLIASDSATFGQPEIRLAFFAPLGVAYLPKLVGPNRAMEITCSGRTYSAEKMYEYGLVTRVVKPEEIESVMEAYLDDIRKASPAVIRLNTRVLKKVRDMPYEEAHQQAEKTFLEELMNLDDVLEGVNSFYEKRKPDWKNK
jgi:cyclohexa-1,5-dienecarbonyl-CoA hydratase